MHDLFYLISPVFSVIVGIAVVSYSRRIADFFQTIVDKLPSSDRYDPEDLTIKPIYITILGVLFTIACIIGVFERIDLLK